MQVAVIGAGWAGCAAAVEAVRLGHRVTVFEAARIPGGRARRVNLPGQPFALDNGQHILIGAYQQTLRLMTDVGLLPERLLLRLPLTLQWPSGDGLALPSWPAPLDALAGIARARGWSWADKWSLLVHASRWQRAGFACPPLQTVAGLCQRLAPRVMTSLIEPLCVSALNTPADRASGAVFLRVLGDSLFAGSGGSNLLLPRVDLSALLPDAALAWVQQSGGVVNTGVRVTALARSIDGWDVSSGDGQENALFDRVILACPPLEAARLASTSGLPATAWLQRARGLQYEAIATVYTAAPGVRLSQPMLALPAAPGAPAQFVFDRGQLDGPPGWLAFVVSASTDSSAALTPQVLQQARTQLGLSALEHLQTIVEKRATFACTPGLLRPGCDVNPGAVAGLLACGDYIDGPYPATLEGAVRSGLQAARLLAGSNDRL